MKFLCLVVLLLLCLTFVNSKTSNSRSLGIETHIRTKRALASTRRGQNERSKSVNRYFTTLFRSRRRRQGNDRPNRRRRNRNRRKNG